ncbi:hypothetical protein AK812_SmicGene5526 [Symbiodinium microadriaticum]|uniref:Uncharacterized protein n=1 Tax=Symbiodinium microadriaticum TaxID=2951 RepID=A0A1Q9ETF6_SYMMI|nr:hypothetical protein AK812_SmicGene5526 [Symbiodinium microadriaticum]
MLRGLYKAEFFFSQLWSALHRLKAKAVKLNKQKAAEEAEEENATEKELKQLHAKPTSLPEDSPACWKAVANQTVRTYITLIVAATRNAAAKALAAGDNHQHHAHVEGGSAEVLDYDIEASAWREIQVPQCRSRCLTLFLEMPTHQLVLLVLASLQDTAAAAGRAAERAALASGATKEVAAEAAALAAARIAKGRFPKPTTATTTTSSTTSSTTRSTTVATRRPPYYDGPTLSPEDTAAAVGAAAQDHALSTGMSYKEAVALGVQAAAEAMERLPGGHVAGDVYHPNPPADAQGFDFAPMATPAASKLPKKPLGTFRMEVHVGAVEPAEAPGQLRNSRLSSPFFASSALQDYDTVAEQLNLTGDGLSWAGHVEVVTSADGRTEIKIDKAAYRHAPLTDEGWEAPAIVLGPVLLREGLVSGILGIEERTVVPELAWCLDQLGADWTMDHVLRFLVRFWEKPGDSPEEALVKQVIHEVTPKVLNRSTHDALPRAAGEAPEPELLTTPLKDLPEAVVEAIGEVLDRADPQVPEAGDKALDAPWLPEVVRKSSDLGLDSELWLPVVRGTTWLQQVLRQILRSYRPDPVHSVSQVVDDSLQEAATTTKVVIKWVMPKGSKVERVDVDNSPEDVLKIIEDVAEKLAGKKLPDAVAPGAVASNASRPHEEEEGEEDEPPESNPKLEMQEQINHTQAIEDDDIRIRDDDPGDDTECLRYARYLVGESGFEAGPDGSEGVVDAESPKNYAENVEEPAAVPTSSQGPALEEDESWGKWEAKEVLESNLVNVTSEADEEPKKMGSGETSPSEAR